MTMYYEGAQVDWQGLLNRAYNALFDNGLEREADAFTGGHATRLGMAGSPVEAYYRERVNAVKEFVGNVLGVMHSGGPLRGTVYMVVGENRVNFPVGAGRVRGSISHIEYALYPDAPAGSYVAFQVADLIRGEIHEGQPSATPSDIVIRELDGWSAGFIEIRPSDELLERIPARAREYAFATDAASSGSGQVFWVRGVPGEPFRFTTEPRQATSITGEQLIQRALTTYREMLRERMQRPNDEREQELRRQREEHRAATQQNFRAFANREPVEEVLVPTLPFVPNGLASSRRWGIEVESGGARGVETPADWRAVSDGSLRSAYDGYIEVQDFEPYEEEVTERIQWQNCEHASSHQPHTEEFDPARDEYIYVPNADYQDPRECESCGNVTRMVLREPQTIHHTARSGDCREFVSPILTSMHSRGLKSLTEALSRNPQNSSAGVHVHVEAGDLSHKQIQTLVFGYDILEPLLESSYKRERRDFCRRREVEQVLRHARDAREGSDLNVDDRYLTLNLQALQRHGTIEFRAMGPVYEYDHLIRWAMLCRELVNVVAAGATMKDFSKVTNWSALLNLLARFGKEYIRAAVYEMTGEVGEAAKLEKQGVPVTAEALMADLSSAWETISARFRNLGVAASDMASRLVGVGSTSET